MVPARAQGFTLIELVIVIAITGIVAAVGGILISGTVGGYVDQDRRATLVADGDRALRRMHREIRLALPNSIRVNDCAEGPCVQFLATAAGGRYREGPGPGAAQPEHRLRFNQADDSFNATGSVGLANGSYDYYLSVYNTGQAGNDAWAGQSMTPNRGVTISDSSVPGEPRIELSQAHQFPLESPRQRFYLVEDPVAFVCRNGRLYRHAGYVLGDDPSSVSGSLLSGRIDSCGFEYAPGGSTRAGLLSMRLVLEEEEERVRLLHQTQVVNAP
ncbi:type II secretion system protein [Gammaproteobacteria bacterium AB-CW1]|uniref:Type II secretion system protein n=1 Tax=Natronospira elongata TaxID=3110268 RepID=A0AAP6JG26_9GAMM|nr:type II secretion system protein [Gammaproteobacteria bacterium AB-CW1]